MAEKPGVEYIREARDELTEVLTGVHHDGVTLDTSLGLNRFMQSLYLGIFTQILKRIKEPGFIEELEQVGIAGIIDQERS